MTRRINRLFRILILTGAIFCLLAGPALADGGVAEGIANLVKKAVGAMIVGGAILFTFFGGFNWLKALIARGAGVPGAESAAIMTLISLAIIFGFLVFSIAITNALIDAIWEVHVDEAIRLPTP